MNGPIFADTCALANKAVGLAYRLRLCPELTEAETVVLKSVSLEIVILQASREVKKQEAGQQAALALAMLHSFPWVHLVMDEQEPLADIADEDLLLRATAASGQILTADVTLQREAKKNGIGVVSVQRLCQRLEPIARDFAQAFPAREALARGDTLSVRIVKPGNHDGEGVGYLADGRMVVLENGRTHIGETCAVLVNRTLPTTQGGEMVFAVLANGEHSA